MHLNTYVGGFGAGVRAFAAAVDPPKLAPLRALERPSLVLTSRRGRVMWRTPPPLPFQGEFDAYFRPKSGELWPTLATINWRPLSYDCRITTLDAISGDEREVAATLATTASEFLFDAEPTRVYVAAVRACTRDGGCSEWSNATSSASDGADRIVVYAKTVGADGATLTPTTLLGEPTVDSRGERALDDHRTASFSADTRRHFGSLHARSWRFALVDVAARL